MEKQQARESLKKLNKEAFSLVPSSALISLFIIDTTDISFDIGLITESQKATNKGNTVFRFHNNVKLINNSIFWQGEEYIAAPIRAEGFELNARGTLPTPKLSLTVNEEGVSALSLLKEKLYSLGDLAGAKVTRIRTFAKYLDRKNYLSDITSDEWEPDSQVEFPRDIYYIDRKSNESKFLIEWELASILDLQEIKLPGRLVVSNRCPARYRAEGCLYEAKSRRVDKIHGKLGTSILPDEAPAVANIKDEKIVDILQITAIVDRGRFEPGTLYVRGDGVFIEKGGIKYYFVAKTNNPSFAPPDTRHWESEQCSKLVSGCKLRFGENGAVIPGTSGWVKSRLMFNGFPSVSKFN